MAKVKRVTRNSTPAKPNGAKPSTLAKAITKVKKSDQAKKELKDGRAKHGIIMLEHIPHGFYENELQSFFSQYGKVLRVKVARSKKTGKSKGYGYVEFEFEEVARIAAESMNNYLMFERLVKCQLLEGPRANGRKIFGSTYTTKDGPKVEGRPPVKEEVVERGPKKKAEFVNQRILNLRRNNAKLAAKGINYKFAPLHNPSLKLVRVPTDASDQTAGKIESTAERGNQNAKTVGKANKSPKLGGKKSLKKERLSLDKKQSVKSPNQKALKAAAVVKLLTEEPDSQQNASKQTPSPKVTSKRLTPKRISGTAELPLPTASDDVSLPSPGAKGKSPKQPTPGSAGQALKRNSKKSKVSLANISNGHESAFVEEIPKLEKSLISPKGVKTTPQNKPTPKTPQDKPAPKTPQQKPTPKTPQQKPTPKTPKDKLTPMKTPKTPKDKPTPKKSPSTPAGKKSPVGSSAPIDDIFDVAEILYPSQSPKSSKRKSDSNISLVLEDQKSPKVAKLTPKLNIKSPANSDASSKTPETSKPTEKNIKKKKSLDKKPKISPKLLRSKKRQSEAVDISAVPVEVVNKKPPKAPKSVPANEAVPAIKTGKSPKFSPKVLRSKAAKNDAPQATPIVSKAKSPKPDASAKKPAGNKETPKFSPKLLRSKARHSDSPAPFSAVKAGRGRKSMR